MDKIYFMCWKCKSEVKGFEIVTRSDVCPDCGKDLHSCRNCQFYSPGSHYDCYESVEELVVDKERSNFCENFKLKRLWGESSEDSESAAAKARRTLDSLFSI